MTAAGSVTRDLTAVIPYPAPPTQTEVLKAALKDAIPTQLFNNGSGGQSGSMQIGDTLICWGYATVTTYNTPYFKFRFTFPKQFQGSPTVTTGINAQTSGFGYAVYGFTASEIEYFGAALEVMGRANNEPIVMNYFAIGKAK